MKIKYEFVNGDISEIEVDNYFGEILKEFNRKQRNSNRVYRRHNYSLESAMYQGEDYGKEDQGLLEILELLDSVTDVQKKRIQLKIQGYSTTEIAEMEGGNSTPQSVRKSIAIVRKKLEQLLDSEL